MGEATTTAVQNQVATAVTAAVANPNVPASVEAVPAILQALAPIITQLLSATNNEPWYKSRVIWGSLLNVVSIVLLLFKIQFPIEMQGVVLNTIMAAVPIVGTALTVYGRYRAKKALNP